MPDYTVKSGDTLGKIAKKFKVSTDSIVRLNNITNPDRIRAGMELHVPEMTTDAMGAVPLPADPPSPDRSTIPIVINRAEFVLPTKEFYPEVTEKTLIVLHFTAGQSARSAFNTWLNSPEHVATAYIVDTDGIIYEIFDPSYWAYHLGVKGTSVHDKRSVGIEIANVGPLKTSPGDPNCLNWWPNNWGTQWCRVEQGTSYVKATYRGIDYFASFSEPQMDAVCKLTLYLCERFGIRKTIPPLARRTECHLDHFRSYQGVAAHQNFRSDKWDVGPAFDWGRLGL